MTQSHILTGVLIVVILGGLSIAGLVSLENRGSSEEVEKTYSSFSSSPNVFASLKNAGLDPVDTENTSSEGDSTRSNILRAWEARVGTEAARAIRANASLQTEHAPGNSNSDIQSLFQGLLGEKILSQTPLGASQGSNQSDLLLWNGLFSNEGVVELSANADTPTQAALRAYTNELGRAVTTFNRSHANQVTLLDAFVTEYTQEENKEAVRALGESYLQLAADIQTLTPPEQIRTTHTSMHEGYAAVGTLLSNITQATSDEDLIERLLTYNKASEAVAKSHVSLITTLSANGVAFQSHEAGSVFSFTPTF